MKEREKLPTESFDWRGITVSVTVEHNWFNIENIRHLHIEAVAREGAPLPITETGYRSHFSNEPIITEARGPVAFLRAWLDAEAAKPGWWAQEVKHRQLSLF